MFYERLGRGPRKVLLVHGYLGSAEIWQPVAQSIAESGRCEVIAMDLPGAGRSGKPHAAPYTLPWLASMLALFAEKLGLRNVLLVGHSLGGGVCIHAVLKQPSLASAMLLQSPLVFRPPPPPGLRFAKRHPAIARVFFQTIGRLFIPMLVEKALYANGSRDPRPVAKSILSALDSPGGWAAATRMGLRAHDYSPSTEMLRRLELPVRVVWGTLDRSHDAELAAQLRLALSNCPTDFVMLAGAGHNAHEEQPELFTDLVVDWLNEWCPNPSE
ncbi:MAG: alpha/beta hydrolase [Deltaproteobacteria bacterium]|nr:MAG: alpha/beta hydrolase [Deltaproteobacteria bacterium]